MIQDKKPLKFKNAPTRPIDPDQARKRIAGLVNRKLEDLPVEGEKISLPAISREIPPFPEIRKVIEEETEKKEVPAPTISPPPQKKTPPPSDLATVKPSIQLPLDEEEIKEGLHSSVCFAYRWLAEWCKRQVKKLRS